MYPAERKEGISLKYLVIKARRRIQAIETCSRINDRHLADPGYFRTWMTRILINKCIDIIRKNKREHPVSDFPEYGEVSREPWTIQNNELMKSASPRVMFRRVMSTRQTAHMRANGTTKRRKEA